MSYSLKLVCIGLVTLIVGILVIALAPFDRQGRRAYRLSRLWTRAILMIGRVQLKVKGLDRLEVARPYIFVANHQSYIDIPALVEALPQFQLRLIAKKELAWFPVFGWALRLSKHIMVDRSGRMHTMASLRRAKDKIAEGFSVVIFPEGTRSKTGGVLPFKRGGFVLAAMAQVPIVPVTIVGSGAILPRGDWRIRKGKIEIVVDAPIVMERQDLKNMGQFSSRVQAVILAHLNRSAEARKMESTSEEKSTGKARAQI
jgi:1-acyl-sn-glycerol-3-phosphate acyltransferase